jgi:hypothetical protein
LQVSSNATGEVVGHFTLYNLVSWQVVLAKSGNFSNQSTGLISNSFEPGIWENYNDQKLPFEWLLTPNTNDEFSNVQNRLEDALKEHFEKAASAEMERIVLEIGEAYGLQLNQPIPQAALKEIMMRYAHWVTSVPYVNAFNLDPYKALVPLGIHNGNKKQTSAK